MRKYLVLLAALFALAGCEQTDPRSALPGRVGPAGELVLVLPESQWTSPVVEAVRTFTDRPYERLPQQENSLDLALLDPHDFDRFWKPHRNILHVEIADRIDTQEPSLRIFKDKYASDQVYAEAKGKTAEAVAEVIRERGGDLLRAVHNAEVRRAAKLIATYGNEALSAEIARATGLHIDFPRDARMVKNKGSFIWVHREMTRMKGGNNHDLKQGWFVYTYPYDTDSVFSMPWLLNKRNALLRQYVQGQPEGSYMTTEMQLPPRYEELMMPWGFTAEIRGLWRMENDFMGGPFYSMTFYDEPRMRIVTVEGYCYAPYFTKREYIREAEAVVKSVRVTGQP